MYLVVQKALTLNEVFNDYTIVKNYFLSLPLNAPNYMEVYVRVIELKNKYNNLKTI